MKYISKFIALVFISIALTFAADAQVIIRVRPVAPRVVRIASPSPRHIWIEEDWAYRNNAYAYTGGHWAEPPAGYSVWVPGHWKDTPRRGWVWRPGHWK